MPRLIRELSASFLIFVWLDNPALLPDGNSISAAIVKAREHALSNCWQQHQAALDEAHARLDAELTQANIVELVRVLRLLAVPGESDAASTSPGSVSSAESEAAASLATRTISGGRACKRRL